MASSKTRWFASQGIWAQHWTRVMCTLASPGNCPTPMSFQVQEGFGSRMQRPPDGVWRGVGKSGERVQREREIQTGPEWSLWSGSHPASWRVSHCFPSFPLLPPDTHSLLFFLSTLKTVTEEPPALEPGAQCWQLRLQ